MDIDCVEKSQSAEATNQLFKWLHETLIWQSEAFNNKLFWNFLQPNIKARTTLKPSLSQAKLIPNQEQ